MNTVLMESLGISNELLAELEQPFHTTGQRTRLCLSEKLKTPM